ncbi:MAG: hypothetical protein IJM93_01195, partial [Oscillospiraceae bacterium]|nr:hypothetical protein [Oscillospiraceae bacterium]
RKRPRAPSLAAMRQFTLRFLLHTSSSFAKRRVFGRCFFFAGQGPAPVMGADFPENSSDLTLFTEKSGELKEISRKSLDKTGRRDYNQTILKQEIARKGDRPNEKADRKNQHDDDGDVHVD